MAANAAGMDGFVNKPVELDILKSEILRVLNREPLEANANTNDPESIRMNFPGPKTSREHITAQARENAKGHAEILMVSLRRGSLDDKQLGEFCRLLESHVDPRHLEYLRATVSRFDFDKAQTIVTALMNGL